MQRCNQTPAWLFFRCLDSIYDPCPPSPLFNQVKCVDAWMARYHFSCPIRMQQLQVSADPTLTKYLTTYDQIFVDALLKPVISTFPIHSVSVTLPLPAYHLGLISINCLVYCQKKRGHSNGNFPESQMSSWLFLSEWEFKNLQWDSANAMR